MFEVRDANRADAQAVGQLFEVLGYPANREDVLQELALAEAEDRSGVVVAVDERDVVGFALYVCWRAAAERTWVCRLSGIATAAGYQRRGIGRLLLKEVERRARLTGCSIIELRSGRRPERASAHAFYPALGYVDSGLDHATYQKRL